MISITNVSAETVPFLFTFHTTHTLSFIRIMETY
jgi:hypothetical protein